MPLEGMLSPEIGEKIRLQLMCGKPFKVPGVGTVARLVMLPTVRLPETVKSGLFAMVS